MHNFQLWCRIFIHEYNLEAFFDSKHVSWIMLSTLKVNFRCLGFRFSIFLFLVSLKEFSLFLNVLVLLKFILKVN